MSSDTDVQRGATPLGSRRTDIRSAGVLLVGGMLLNVVSTLMHPSGQEDDHQAVFEEYAESGTWVAVHLGQFVGVLMALGGLLVLHRVLGASGRSALLAYLAAAATVATAAVWAVLQGLDGVGLRQAAEAWLGSSDAERSARFAGAEAVRWLEWGLQSYFRVLLGITFALSGAAILLGRLVAGWLGWAAVLAGLLSVVMGVDVGYTGLASGVQDFAGVAFLVIVLAFAVGILASGFRGGARRSRQPETGPS